MEYKSPSLGLQLTEALSDENLADVTVSCLQNLKYSLSTLEKSDQPPPLFSDATRDRKGRDRNQHRSFSSRKLIEAMAPAVYCRS